jgi:hypothetical protein
MKYKKYLLLGALFIAAAIGVGGCIVSRPYSTGHRDGYVQKFSVKGFIRKSWEGDLALAGSARTSQAIGNVWHFTVFDKEAVNALEQINAGHLVRLHYDEYLWTTGGDTNYRVTKVERLKE